MDQQDKNSFLGSVIQAIKIYGVFVLVTLPFCLVYGILEAWGFGGAFTLSLTLIPGMALGYWITKKIPKSLPWP